MAEVRVLVGTRKGAFVITSDGTRRDWKIEGPHFGGWEVMHIQGSPADADRLYASQWTDWHGQVVQRSDDGGKSWEAVGNEFAYKGVTSTHQWYDGTPHPWEFKRVWHLAPSPDDPDTVYAGVEDAALFCSSDGGHTWTELRGAEDTLDGAGLDARGRRHVPPYDPHRPWESRADVRGDIRSRSVPQRRRR